MKYTTVPVGMGLSFGNGAIRGEGEGIILLHDFQLNCLIPAPAILLKIFLGFDAQKTFSSSMLTMRVYQELRVYRVKFLTKQLTSKETEGKIITYSNVFGT